MPDIKHYFDEEMRYLQKAGQDFAQEHPDAARRLSLGEAEDRDPYVERLLEGFAFLTGRIRQTLDMEDDGLAGHLLELVAPGIEIPLPSVVLVEFAPRPSEFSLPVQLRRGMQVQSVPVPGQESACRFSLTRDMTITAISLSRCVLSEDHGGSVLELELEHWGNAPMAGWPDPLPIYLHGDPALSWAMRYWLLRQVQGIHADLDGLALGPSVRLEASATLPGYAWESGGAGDALLAMRDFLNAEERFRTVEIRGLGAHPAGPGARLKLRLRFRDSFPRALEREVGTDLFRLHVVPVVNCYEEDCEPVQMDLTRVEYPLEARRGASMEILDVREVVGTSQSDMSRRRRYLRFSSYRHLGRKGNDAGYFEVVRHERRSGGYRMGLTLGNSDSTAMVEGEYLSVRALCCDGDSPREHLQPSDIQVPDPAMPTSIAVRGLTRPSAVARPQGGSTRRWSVLAHFHRSFRGLTDLELLKRTLEQLAWDTREFRRSLIDALVRVSSKPVYRMVRGVAHQEILVVVVLRDEQCTATAWERLGQVDAFGALLWGMFRDEAPLGAGVRLRLEVEPAGAVLEYSAGE